MKSITFSDRAFGAQVCHSLGLPAGTPLTAEMLAGITVLDVSECGIVRLSGLKYFTALRELYCGGNRLQHLDLSVCPTLETVSCAHNRLERLKLGALPALRTLVCSANYLSGLDLSNCPELCELLCENNLLTRLTLPKAPKLVQLWCQHNRMKRTDLDLTAPDESCDTPQAEGAPGAAC